ncbi:hypothetical protein KSS87_002540, partial [Heliosperma pusillum]
FGFLLLEDIHSSWSLYSLRFPSDFSGHTPRFDPTTAFDCPLLPLLYYINSCGFKVEEFVVKPNLSWSSREVQMQCCIGAYRIQGVF